MTKPVDELEIPARESPYPTEPWVMPDWMLPYEPFIAGHGGNGVTDLMNRLRTQRTLAFSNIIVFTMCCEVSAQVHLLTRLREANILPKFAVGDVVEVAEGAEAAGKTGRVHVAHDPEPQYTVTFDSDRGIAAEGFWTYRSHELVRPEVADDVVERVRAAERQQGRDDPELGHIVTDAPPTKACASCQGTGYADGENGAVSDRPCAQCDGAGTIPDGS